MSADGYIPEPEKLMTMFIRCYKCSKSVDRARPLKGHENCLVDGKLMIDIEFMNYVER